jgi:hypothetical protein
MGKVYPDYAAVNAVTTKEPQSPVLQRAYEIFDFCHRRTFGSALGRVSPKCDDVVASKGTGGEWTDSGLKGVGF